MNAPSASVPILVIAGPTATGKTGAAIAIAHEIDGEVVSADSVQVYRGFDIGSAKATPEQLEGVPQHMVDIVDPNESIDAAEYARRADACIEDVVSRGRVPIVVGGTGLWLRALVRGLVPLPELDTRIRARLEREAKEDGGNIALHRRLADVDSVAASAIHPNDRLRIVRALEVYEQTGTPLGELRSKHALGAPRYNALFIVIDCERDELANRIVVRTQAMIRMGWANEVVRLRARWGDEARPFGSVGYRDMLAHVRDGVSLEETERRIARSTRIYARRQRTWFRSEPGISLRTTADELAAGETRARIREHVRTAQ